MTAFYRRVAGDAILAPVFAVMSPDHPKRVAAFLAEVFGGPKTYSAAHGGHPHMVRQHLGRMLTEEQRAHWMRLLLVCADEAGIPADPEFRSAFVGYLEWGTRLAVINSGAGATVDEHAQMPRWGWGETGGPYIPPSKD